MDETDINWSEVGKRLTIIQKKLVPKSSRQFALSIGADPAYLKKAVDGNRISQHYIDKIKDVHHVSKEWLLYGVGDMLSVDNVNKTVDEKKDDSKTGFSEVNSKYILLLEKNLNEKESQITSLQSELQEIKSGIKELMAVKELADKNAASLNVLTRKMTVVDSKVEGFAEEILSHLANEDLQVHKVYMTSANTRVNDRLKKAQKAGILSGESS